MPTATRVACRFNRSLNSKRIVTIVLWLTVLLLSGVWLTFRTSVTTDLTAFLPEARTESEHLLLDELRAGPAARMILVGIEGADPDLLAATSNRLVMRLNGHAAFATVANGAELLAPTERALLFSHRYLLSPRVSAQRFSAGALEQALRQRLRELASPLGSAEKDFVLADPTAEFRALLESWRDSGGPLTFNGVWFDSAARRALLVLETVAGPFDIDAQARALAEIRDAFGEVSGGAQTRLLLAGPGLYAVTARDVTRRETQVLSAAATVAVALILLAGYRSAVVLALAALPLLSGILLAAAAVSVWFGSIHGLTLAFGIALVGVAIDYPIHVFSHMRGGHSMAQALARIWPTLRVGVITTALGFSALIGAGFAGLAQLGVFAVCGLFGAAAVTRWVLPALMPEDWSLPSPRQAQKVLGLIERVRGRLGPFVAATIVLGLVLLLFRGPFPWEDDLAGMSPIPERARQLDAELRRDLGAPEVSQAVVITAPDPESALQRTEQAVVGLERLVDENHLRGFTAVTRYLPSAKSQQTRQDELPTAAQLEASLARATAELPFRRGVFEPFLAAMDGARTQSIVRMEDLADSSIGTRISSLLFRSSESWASVIPLVGLRDSSALADWAHTAGPDVHFLDQRVLARDLMTRFREEGLSRAVWSAAIIVLVLAAALRSPRRMVRVLLPIILAAVLDLSLLIVMGDRISLFHLVGLLLAMGAGVDYSLFFNRFTGALHDHRRTLHALLMCAATTVVLFGILAWSEIPVLQAIGRTVAIGVSASLLFALLMAERISDRPALSGQ
jgi:predicted exporter